MGARVRVAAALLSAMCAMSLAVSSPSAIATAAATTAAPAALREVTGFGSNPGDLQMFEYVPDELPARAPLVVVMHGCFGSASAYDDETGWLQLATERKWALVFPQQKLTNNDNLCFSWVSEDDITRGGGEALSIVQMVRWMQKQHRTDRARTYATGHSAGGYFTSVLLATYPDVFTAGAVVSGGPYRCQTYQKIAAAPGVWVEPSPNEFLARKDCTQGIDRTPQQWGDLLRLGHSRWRGPKPRIALWHGSVDDVVVPMNMRELLEQWTNHHGIDRKPEVRNKVAGYPHAVYADKAGTPLIETYVLTGRGHSYPGDGSAACPGQEDVGICAPPLIADWFEP